MIQIKVINLIFTNLKKRFLTNKIKEFKLFECIAMTESHVNICRTLSLAHFKPYDVIYYQGEIGDSFYYILNGIVKQTIHKKIDNPIFAGASARKLSTTNLNKNLNEISELNEDNAQIIEVS